MGGQKHERMSRLVEFGALALLIPYERLVRTPSGRGCAV
jgi:hypothetical protein